MQNLPENLKYAESHEWANLEPEQLVRIGITDFAQSELGDLVFVELPEKGRQLQLGEKCAVVESVKTASDLFSPVNGEVVDVNEGVIDQPELVNEDAFSNWLFVIRADDPAELDQLMSSDEYGRMIDD